MQTPKARNQRMASPTGVARIFAAKHGVGSGGGKKKPEPSTPTGLGELMATPARAVVPRGRSITPQQPSPALSPALALHTSLNSSKKRLLSASSRVEDLTPRAKNSKTAKRLKGDLDSRKQAAAEQRRLARAATKSAPFSPDATVAWLYSLPKTPKTETVAPASPTGLAAMMKTPGAYKATLGKQQAAATGSKRKRPTQEREPSPGVMKRTFASPKPKKTKMSAVLSPGGMHRTFASPMVSAQAVRSPTRSIGSPVPVVLPAAEEKKPSRGKGRATKVEKVETKEEKMVSPSPKKPRGRATRSKAAAIVTPVSASPKVRATRGRRAAQSQVEAAPAPTKVEAVATPPAPKRGRGKKAAASTTASAESAESSAAASKSGKANTTSARSSRTNKGKKDKETVVASPVASPPRTRRSARLR
jgi:hypothetical protein